jgi:hypothetical protein
VTSRTLHYSTSIFESFEPESDDEEEDDDEEAENEDDQKLTTQQDADEVRKMKELALKDFPDGESVEEQEDAPSEEEEDIGTGVQTSQLRHFVIQVCDTSRASSDSSGI